MQTFRNLNLSVRLGAAFGALAVALIVATVVSFNGLKGLEEDTHKLSDRDVNALRHLVTVSEDFLANGYLLLKHLYVEDGDVRAQDATAKQIAEFDREALESIDGLRPKLETEAGREVLARFAQSIEQFQAASGRAIELSRQETVDGVEERDGSRSQYLDEVIPVFERLDVVHDELEGIVDGQATKQAEKAADQAAAAKRTVLLIGLLALLVATGLAIVVTRSVTRPVAALGTRLRSLNDNCLTGLSEGIDAVAKGDLTKDVVAVTTPVEVRGSDEIGRLSETFNEMLGKVEGTIESYTAMREQLATLIGEVSAGAGTVSAASEQMASTSDEAGRAVGEIASAVGDVAQGAERQVRMV
jgi:methyl-accepting chemotaxis protein